MDDLTNEEAAFLEEVERGITAKDPERLSEVVSDYSEYCFNDPASKSEGSDFSASFVDRFLKMIEDPDLLQLDDSFKLLILLHNDWARINTRFYPKLFKVLEHSYPEWADHTTQLLTVELLGKYLANADGLHGLQRLRAVKNAVARAYVAYGFKCLALNATSEAVRKTAVTRLNEMAEDSSSVVRAEAYAAIATLK